MGRPSKDPTDEQRSNVRQWVAAKVSIEEMARRVGFACKTFRKHFAVELGISPIDRVITDQAQASPSARADAFRPNSEQREVALILAGAQLSRPEIARKMGLAVEVLEEHFADELVQGPVKCKADIIQAMFYAGKGGNVAAAKVYLVFNGQGPPEDKMDAAQPAAIGLLGKKESAAIAARTAGAGTAWDDLVPATTKPN